MRREYHTLRNAIKEIWPQCSLWLADKYYWLPSRESLDMFLSVRWKSRRDYLKEVWDCDDFTLQMVAEAHLYVALSVVDGKIKKGDAVPWALGEAWVRKIKNRATKHSIGVCLTTEGLVLIEPITDEVWAPDGAKDDVYYARI